MFLVLTIRLEGRCFVPIQNLGKSQQQIKKKKCQTPVKYNWNQPQRHQAILCLNKKSFIFGHGKKTILGFIKKREKLKDFTQIDFLLTESIGLKNADVYSVQRVKQQEG